MAERTLHLALIAVIGCMAASVRANADAEVQGYTKPISNPEMQFYAQGLLQKAVTDIGLPARLQSCRLFEQVSMGVRNGETAYAAACQIVVGDRAPREFVLCTSDVGGGLTLHKGSFVNSAEWMEDFTRKNCF